MPWSFLSHLRAMGSYLLFVFCLLYADGIIAHPVDLVNKAADWRSDCLWLSDSFSYCWNYRLQKTSERIKIQAWLSYYVSFQCMIVTYVCVFAITSMAGIREVWREMLLYNKKWYNPSPDALEMAPVLLNSWLLRLDFQPYYGVRWSPSSCFSSCCGTHSQEWALEGREWLFADAVVAMGTSVCLGLTYRSFLWKNRHYLMFGAGMQNDVPVLD